MYHFVSSHATRASSSKYWRNVGNLSIDMSADNQKTTLGRHIDQQILIECWSTYRPMLDRYVNRHISVDVSTDTRPIYRSTYRPTLDRYVRRYISRGVRKIHMIPIFNSVYVVYGTACVYRELYGKVTNLKVVL